MTRDELERIARGIASRLMLSGEKVKGEQLALEFGLGSSQKVREVVNWARKQGDPHYSRIGSEDGASGGYFWLTSQEEAKEVVSFLRNKSYSILDAARGLAKSFHLDNIDQEELAL